MERIITFNNVYANYPDGIALSDISRADVPELTAIPFLLPIYFEKSFSNSFTLGPLVKSLFPFPNQTKSHQMLHITFVGVVRPSSSYLICNLISLLVCFQG